MPTELSKPKPCIERRSPFRGDLYCYSVFEYDRLMDKGRSLSHSKARAFHEVIWTEAAPEVYELTIDGAETREGRFRITDRAPYDEQMRQLLGIDPRPENASWIY